MPATSEPRVHHVCRFLFAFLILGAAAACGGSGAPLTGNVNGTFLTTSFTPKYGTAKDLASPPPVDGAEEVQISDAPINCSDYLAATTSGGPGLYASIYLASFDTGPFSARLVRFERLVLQGHALITDKGFFANTGSGEVTAADDQHVEASITFDNQDTNEPASFSGSLSVTRCH